MGAGRNRCRAALYIAADHPMGDLFHARLFGGNFLDQNAVAHDSDFVAYGQDLLQAVRDKDYGDASCRHTADRVKKRLRFSLRQNGRGLVQDQDPELLFGQFSRDLGKLLVTDRHAVDHHVLIDRHAHLLDSGLGSFVHFLAIERIQSVSKYLRNDITLLGLTVEQNVLCRVKTRNQGKFLVYHTDTGRDRLKGRAERNLLSVDQDISAVAACRSDVRGTEEDLHQRRLSCTVLTAQTKNIAFIEL